MMTLKESDGSDRGYSLLAVAVKDHVIGVVHAEYDRETCKYCLVITSDGDAHCNATDREHDTFDKFMRRVRKLYPGAKLYSFYENRIVDTAGGG